MSLPPNDILNKVKQSKLLSGVGAATTGALTPENEVQAAENTVSFDPLKINEALKEGFTIPQIKEFLGEEADGLAVDSAIHDVILQKALKADEAGYEIPEIKQFMIDDLGMESEEVDQFIRDNDIGFTPVPTQELSGEDRFPISTEISSEPLEFSPEEIAVKYKALHSKYSTIGKTAGGLIGIEDFAKEAFTDQRDLAINILTGLQKHGIVARGEVNNEGLYPSYDIIIDGPNGPEVLDSDIFQDILNSKYELAGALSMAAATHRGVALLPMPPLLKFILTAAGGGAGAAAGKAADLTTLADAVNELDNIKSKFYIERMIDAGVADVTFGIIGTTAIKASIGTVKILGGAFDTLLRGNVNGAYKALKDHIGLDDEQIKAIIKEWEKVSTTKAPGLTIKSKSIHVIPQTIPGAEDIISQASSINPRVGSAISRVISKRADDVIQAVNKITPDNVVTVLHDDLNKYVDDVKNYYGGIKNHAVSEMNETPYLFDYYKTTLDPLFQRMERNIQNPATLERFKSRLEKVRVIGEQLQKETGTPPPRKFGDLLDLAKVVNEFRYNSRISGHGNLETIKKIQDTISAEIEKAVTKHMNQSKLWLSEWKKANLEYSKMLKLKDNVMYKALTKPGVNYDKAVNALVRDIKSIDGTFMQVMGKLPAKTRTAVEGAVLKKLIANNTVGEEGGLKAIHFPSLQKELTNVGFTDPASREIKRAISQLANVFKNDVNVFRSTGQIKDSKFTSYLTYDPVVRLKFEVANKSFNFFKRMLPTAKGEATALITKAAKVLEDPANSKNINDLIKALPDDPELASDIKRLAIEYAKFGYPEHYPKVEVFRTFIPGKSAKAIDGPYGKGVYWTTDKAKAVSRGKATGAGIKTEKINPARIASIEDMKKLFGDDFDPKSLKTNPAFIEQLKDKYFLGVSVDDTAVVFK